MGNVIRRERTESGIGSDGDGERGSSGGKRSNPIRRFLTTGLTAGTVIVVIGLLLLLTTTGLVQVESIWGWFAALFVVVGLWALIKSEFRNLVGPVMVIAIAGTLFLRNVGVIAEGILSTWWPLFVVLFGVLVAISRSRRKRRNRSVDLNDLGEVSVVSVFGSDDRRIRTDRFTGADLVAIFGDGRLDLTHGNLGIRPAVVDVTSVFGDAEIRVPADWEVRLDTMSILGSVRDRRPDPSADRHGDGQPDLIVTGVAVLGDIEIRD